MSRLRRPTFAAVVTVFVLGLAAAAGALFGERTRTASEHAVVSHAAEIVSTMLEWLPDEEQASTLIYDGIDGMLEKLDPHSNFLDPSSFSRMRDRQQGAFFGIGIIISRRAGQVTVIAPMAGTPAARKGLRAGDVIAAIEGEPTDQMSLDDVVDRVRGPEGTVVNLSIVRPGLKKPLEVAITRARIPTNSVRYAFMLQPEIGYIRLSEFSATSSAEIHAAVHRLEGRGMRSLILDLRDNPGGSLDAAIGVSDTFLRPGQLIVSTRGRTEDSISTLRAPGRGEHFDGPLVIIVNTGTASAAEIVSGAVQDHDRGVLVGEVTWGKGLVQTVFTIRDVGLALTTARYYTPSGRCIQRDYHSFLDYITHRNGKPAPDTPAANHTDDGRPVRGGGGITPDVVVEARVVAEPVARLYGQSAFFRFAINIVKGFPDADRRQRATDFVATSDVLDRFWSFVKSEKLLDETMLDNLRSDTQAVDDVSRAIRTEVLNSAVGLEAGYRVAIQGDNQIAAAVDHLPEAKKMWEAWEAEAKKPSDAGDKAGKQGGSN
jgi:carboxyl-terminal processing protease